MSLVFRDRASAGRDLADRLQRYAGHDDVVVLGLPRGGVVVAAEVARALDAPLDVYVVRKLGLPDQPELAMGAIASGGVTVLNHDLVALLGIDPKVIEAVAARESQELARRDVAYRRGRPPRALDGKTVLLVDDGVATGATMRAAVAALRQLGPARVVVAAPVMSREAHATLARAADEVECLSQPEPFFGVGAWYSDFRQTTDDEVRDLLGARPAASRELEPTDVHRD
jgi:predicted phosphoribosyltransferase